MIKLDGQPIKGIIYDLDGTLASSTLNFKAMRQSIGCPQSSDMLNFIEAIEDKTEQQRALQMILDNEWQDALDATALPCAVELLAYCKAHHIPQAIVTRNNANAAQQKVTNCHFDIDWLISREQFPAKPEPTALLHIANTWQIDPQYLIYVGDFKYDIQAAHNAGMKSVLVNAKTPNDYSHLADWQFATLADFYHHLQNTHISAATASL